jgi:hypothetical protein
MAKEDGDVPYLLAEVKRPRDALDRMTGFAWNYAHPTAIQAAYGLFEGCRTALETKHD